MCWFFIYLLPILSEKPKFWVIRQQSLIHAKAGDTKGAIKAAKKSLELAQKANNRDYINMNTVSLKEWEVDYKNTIDLECKKY